MKKNYTPIGKLLWGPKPDMSKVRSGIADAYARSLERTPERLMQNVMSHAMGMMAYYAMTHLGRK